MGSRFRQLNWFTGQGIIATSDVVRDRILYDCMPTPTQYWLDYREDSLSSLFNTSTAIVNDFESSITFILPTGKLVLVLEPEWNLLPREVHQVTSEGAVLRRITVEKAKASFRDDVYIPELFSCELCQPGANNSIIPVDKISWTVVSVTDFPTGETLDVTFPKGAFVADNVGKKNYQVGNPTSQLDQATRLNIGNDGESAKRIRLLIVALILGAIAFCAFYWMWNRQKNASQV